MSQQNIENSRYNKKRYSYIKTIFSKEVVINIRQLIQAGFLKFYFFN